MADVQSNIHVNIDTSDALASLKLLQRQISAFHSQMSKSGASASAIAGNQAQNLMNSINATGKFQASMRSVKSSTESFTDALERNRLTSREYFRYTGAATKTFGRLFKSEFDTINKVARERVKDVQTQYIKMGRGANGALEAIAVRPLSLDMKNLGTQTAMAAQKQQMFNQLLKQGSTNILNFGKNTQWSGRQLMVGFTVPLVMLGTTASKVFMQLEEQAIRFKRVYGELFTTAEETDRMVEEIQTLAKEYTKYGVAVEETMKMAADAAAQGKVGAELLAQVSQATRLAVLGGVEQEEALKTTISITNAFGIAAEDLTKKVDFLNAVENQTVVSIEDLTIAIPKAGPVVKQLGGDVEDLAFFLTAMKEGGINASEGANALKSGLASLINPSDKAAKMLMGLGVNIRGIVEANSGDVKSTVIDFANALDTLDPLNRARAIEQLFGKFQFSRLSTLFQNVVAEGTQAARVLSLTQATTEELAILSERELSRIEDTTTYKFKKSIEDLKVTIAPVGEQFLKALTPIVEFVTNILDKFNNLGEGSKKFLTIMTVVLGGIGPIALMSFGLLANGVANIIKLFATMRSGFNRAGSSTQMLGQQTSYLTQEQLEASAVAASLDQVHQKLKQTFTSEASAINGLTAAYQRAIAAQRAFGIPGVRGAGKPPQKFAEGGIISGPGGPKSDSIPIMASNGEAIISAGIVDKYPGLVNGLIAGEIPGFKKAGIVGGNQEPMAKGFGNATIFLPESMNTMMGGTGVGAPSADVTGYLKGAGRAAMAPLMAALAKEIGVGLNNPKYIQDFRTLGDRFVLEATNALEKSGKKFITDSDFEEIVVPAMKRAANEVTVAGKTLGTAFDNAVTQIRTVAPVGVGSGSDGSKGRTGLRGSYRNMRKSAQTFAMGENPAFFQKRMRFSKSKNKEVGSFQTLNPTLKKFEVATMSHITRSVTMSVNSLIEKVRPYLGDQSAKIVQAVTKSTVEGIKVAAKVASPSKETQRVGADIGRGAVIGVQSYVDDASTAGKQIGAALVQGSQSKAAASRTALYGTGPVDAEAKSIRRQLERQQRLSVLGKNVGVPASVIAPNVAAAAQKQTMSSRMSGFMQRRQDRKAARIESGQGRGMGAGGSMMAASGVMMAASMIPGKVGETAQKLMIPMMALTMVLPLLTSKLGILGVAVGVIAGSIYYFNKVMEKARQEGMELAKAMSMGADKIKQLSLVTGKVSATEEARRRRENTLSGSSEAQRRTGQNILESDFGKTLMSDIDKQTKFGIDAEGIGQNVATSLSEAVIQGAITTEQAKSIASALGEKLGDYSIPATITGNLVQLLGPNGENLYEDPLSVSLEIKNRSMNNVEDIFQQALKVASKNSGFAGASSKDQGYLESVKNNLKNLLDPTTVIDEATENKQTAKINVAAVQAGAQQIQQSQGLVDSLNKQYAIKIQNAKTDKEALDLEKERKANIDDLNKANKQTLIDIKTLSGNMSNDAFNNAINLSIDSLNKDATDSIKVMAELVKEELKGVANTPFKKDIQLGLASGDLSSASALSILEGVAENKELAAEVRVVIQKQGFAELNTLTQLFGRSGASASEQTLMLNYINNNQEGFDTDLKAIGFLAEFKKQYDITLDLETNGVKQIQVATKAINAIAKQPEKLDLKLVTQLAGENPEIFGPILENWTALSQGKETINKNLVVNYLVGRGDPNLIAAANTEFKGEGLSGAPAAARFLGKGFMAPPPPVVERDPSKNTTSTEVDSSPLDELVKRLRDVRMNQVKVTEGFAASSKAISKLFGGSKTISVFSGIENDMRDLGAGEDLIDLITGMDPKEYEAQKRKLFKFDAKDNIIGIKDTARSIGDAIQSIKLGEFVSEQQRMSKQIGNQTAALKRLQTAGVEGSVALEAVADATFAASIANKKLSDKELRKIVKAANEATTAQKRLAASSGLITEQAEMKQRVDLLKRLTANASQFTNDQLEAIMSNPALQNALITLRVDDPQFKKTIDEAIEKANVELNIKKITISGKQDIFSEGFNNAMEEIDIKEKALQLKFTLDTRTFNDVIDKAQDEIALAQFDIDDREAGLKQIEDQEERINEKYDERAKALEDVAKANASISQQQKGQLTLAEALTSGDIAAAAKAAQDMRAQQAADAVTKQQEALEKSREFELARAMTKDGKTRKQLEKEIKDLQDKIFNIEETRIEPAQEQIRKLEATLREAIKPLDVQRSTWEIIKNNIDLARVATEKFQNAIREALNIAESLRASYSSERSVNPVTSNDVASVAAVTSAAEAGAAILNATVEKTAEAVVKETSVSSTAAADAYALAKSKGDMNAAAIAAAGVNPSKLASMESGSIGAASIASQLKSAEARLKASNPTALTGAQIIANRRAQFGYLSDGGLIPKFFAAGGFAKGTDTVPAMLTPGEFVVSKYGVDSFGVDNLRSINNGQSATGSVYNNTYTLTVNAKTDANPNEIAQAVMSTIKKVDDRRVRGLNINGR